jgi:hypothetical protein
MSQDLENSILPSLADWGLSPAAVLLLSREPEILADLECDRQLPPFPASYVPRVIDILFDDLPYIRSEDGGLVYVRDCSVSYQPKFVEYRFDDEIAVFHIGDEYVINRLEEMVQVLTRRQNASYNREVSFARW